MSKYKLCTNCIPIKGYKRSVLYDIQRGDFHPFSEILLKSNDYNFINNNSPDWFDYYLENDLIFKIDENEINEFPDIDMTFEYPAKISNAILCISEITIPLYSIIINDLISFGCKYFVLFFNAKCKLTDLIQILKYFNQTVIKSIIFYFKEPYNIDELKNIIMNQDEIHIAYIYDSKNKENIINENSLMKNIVFIEKSYIEYSNSYNINPIDMNFNMLSFTESQLHNTYFNRKVCIDADGNIKNSPEHERSFGNIKDTTIEEAIEKPGFKDLWFIHKEMIDVCKDCEFRHMCVDACTPLQRADGSWYRSQECNYNPYICKWDDEEGYQNLASCGVVCNSDIYSIDHEKIASINLVLWEDEE